MTDPNLYLYSSPPSTLYAPHYLKEERESCEILSMKAGISQREREEKAIFQGGLEEGNGVSERESRERKCKWVREKKKREKERKLSRRERNSTALVLRQRGSNSSGELDGGEGYVFFCLKVSLDPFVISGPDCLFLFLYLLLIFILPLLFDFIFLTSKLVFPNSSEILKTRKPDLYLMTFDNTWFPLFNPTFVLNFLKSYSVAILWLYAFL